MTSSVVRGTSLYIDKVNQFDLVYIIYFFNSNFNIINGFKMITNCLLISLYFLNNYILIYSIHIRKIDYNYIIPLTINTYFYMYLFIINVSS